MSSIAHRDRAGADRRGAADRSPQACRGLRRHAGAHRHSSGRREALGHACRGDIGAGARILRGLGGTRATRLPPPRARWTAAADSCGLDATPDVQDVLDTFRMIARTPAGSLGAYVITMTRCASDVLAVELLQKEARVAGAAARRSALRDVARSAERRRRHGRLARASLVPRANRWPAGSDDRILRLGQRRRPAHRRLGSLQSAGGDRRGVQPSRHPRHAVPRPGRQRGPRRRTHPSGDHSRSRLGSIDGTLRVTEQGEMLQALFGLPDIALRTMEVYTTERSRRG